MDQVPVGQVPAGHVTPGQLAYWRRSGLLRPGRGELTQARAIAALRRAGLSLRHIRGAAERLRLVPGAEATAGPAAGGDPARHGLAAAYGGAAVHAGRAEPSQLRFAVHGQELFVQRDGGAWEGDRAPGQLILDGVVPFIPVDVVAVGPLPGGVPPGSPGPAAPRRRQPGPAGQAGQPGPAGPAGQPGPARRPRAATPSDRDQIRLFLTRQRDLDPVDLAVGAAARPDAREALLPALRCDSTVNSDSTANITEHPGRPLHRN